MRGSLPADAVKKEIKKEKDTKQPPAIPFRQQTPIIIDSSPETSPAPPAATDTRQMNASGTTSGITPDNDTEMEDGAGLAPPLDALESVGSQSRVLIRGIQRLQVLGIDATLPSLPKFVVIGDQSAGKSSIVS